MERALIESGGGSIGPEHLRFVRIQSENRTEPARASSPRPGGIDDPQMEKILSHLRSKGSINNSECRELLSAGLQHASYLLRKAQRAGWIERISSGRWARYYLPGTGAGSRGPLDDRPTP